MKGYRQGDVIIIPSYDKSHYWNASLYLETDVIKEGEITGHKHQIVNGKLYKTGDTIHIKAETGCKIIHPEHSPIALPRGNYEIRFQQEAQDEQKAQPVKD